MGVKPPGGPTQIQPPQGPDDQNTQELAKNLKTLMEEFTKQIQETMQQPHLLDSEPNLTAISTNLIKLHEIANKAATLPI